jgi:hypothetical protein
VDHKSLLPGTECAVNCCCRSLASVMHVACICHCLTCRVLLILQLSQARKTKEEKLGSQLNELQRAGY